jgi:hypothetical protein
MWAFGNEKEHQTVKEARTNYNDTEMQQRMKHVVKKWEMALRISNKDYKQGIARYNNNIKFFETVIEAAINRER